MKYLLLPIMLLAGCGDYPRDIEGTLGRIETRGTIAVGIIAGAGDHADRPKIEAYLSRVAQATRAQPRLIVDAAEPLLLRLEGGELDLVIGEVAADTPWKTDVAILEPITTRPIGDTDISLSPIARNGENRWIMLLERELRDMQEGG